MVDLSVEDSRVRELLVKFIREETEKAGFNRVVLGLSGGVDSSLTAYLAVEALGIENVMGIYMPYRTSPPESAEDAKLVAQILGIKLITIDITPQIDAYFEKFPEADRIRRGNKMARERMSILYDQSKVYQALVLGTGNKTEALLGYTTLWGDMACDLNPLGGLYKTQVRQLAQVVGVPNHIVAKVPSAELWVGQTDEGELGFTYEEVDKLLYLMIDLKYSKDKLIQAGFDEKFVDEVKKRVKGAEHKRRMPKVAEI